MAAGPRLSGGMAASVVLHAGLIAALVFLHPGSHGPEPPIVRVNILAAPAGDRAAGVVRTRPQPQAAPPTPAPIPKTTKTVAPKKAPAIVKPKQPPPTPTVATPESPTNPPEKAKPENTPTAGGGPTGGRGNDVATVQTDGIDFPYQPYVDNIVSQIIRRFHTNLRLTAEVQFMIHRDGSVDAAGITVTVPSASYAFNQAARAAVEEAANAKAFGPLPPGFREDILPVRFRFSPALLR